MMADWLLARGWWRRGGEKKYVYRYAFVTTFGDLLRVPGSKTSLEQELAEGADVRIVYSPLDALTIAADNRHRPVVFLGVGFETTAPAMALAVKQARERGLE
ncbi:hydrogenase expression/formation protein HypD, partial [Candidatus Hakubella thermalkaliphila]